jgi:regulation of enolase protein 1 (concanavalin A-like superfamily)
VVPAGFSSFVGRYFFGDYTSGVIQVLNPSDKSHSTFDNTIAATAGLVDLDVGPDGNLYYTLVSAGEIWTIKSTTSATQSIMTSTKMFNANEGSSGTFTVRLAAQPGANIVVNLAKTSGDAEATVSPTSLTFTSSNWSTPQTVRVTAGEDTDTLNESVAVTCSASGLSSVKVIANTIDNDDGAAPTALISAPTEADVLRGSNLDYFGGSNLDGSSKQAQFFIDGALKYTDVGTGHYHYLGSHQTFDSTLLKEGSHTLKFSVFDTSNRVGSHQIKVNVDNLPSPWNHEDVGAVGAAGSASSSSGKFTVNASGADVWGAADELHFVYKTLSGDGEIKARVTAVENTNTWAKAGVMIRGSVAANSMQAFMLLSAGGQLAFQRRATTGGSSASTAGPTATAPRWVRLKRAGSTITAFQGTDGSAWSTVGSASIAMGASVLVGLGVTSHADGTLCTATFDNVSTTGTTTATNLQLLTVEGEEIDDSPGTITPDPVGEDGSGAFGCGGGDGQARSAALAAPPFGLLAVWRWRRRRR